MEITSVRDVGNNKTENGTSIVKKGREINKEIFLKMLVAQMTNQDPLNTQDPSQYITQLSQFSALEQIISLNDSVKDLINMNNGILVNSSLQTASSLIGKNVEVHSSDENGVTKKFVGDIKSVSIENNSVFLDVSLDNTKEIKKFKYSELVKVN